MTSTRETRDAEAQIIELEKKNKILKADLDDANQMLSHFQKHGQNRYADDFYSPVLKRVVDSLSKENKILVKQLSRIKNDEHIKDIKDIAKRNSELENLNLNLKDQLQQKFKENQRLSFICDGKGNLEQRVSDISRKYDDVQTENRRLKSIILLNSNTMTYLKEIVDDARDEFLLLFSKCYTEHGEEFVSAMKDVSERGIPEFLKKPLRKDEETSTTDIEDNELGLVRDALKNVKIGEKEDNGYGSLGASLNDDLQRQTIMMRDLKKENLRKEKEIDELNKKLEKNSNDKYEKTISVLKNTIEDMEQKMQRQEREHQQIISELLQGTTDNELQTVKILYQEQTEETRRLEKENNELTQKVRQYERQYQDMLKAISQIKNDPFKNRQPVPIIPEPTYSSIHHPPWMASPRTIVVTDSAADNNQQSKTEKKRNSVSSSQDATENNSNFWKKNVEALESCEKCGDKLPSSIMASHICRKNT